MNDVSIQYLTTLQGKPITIVGVVSYTFNNLNKIGEVKWMKSIAS